jgi:hypothetical protein
VTDIPRKSAKSKATPHPLLATFERAAVSYLAHGARWKWERGREFSPG